MRRNAAFLNSMRLLQRSSHASDQHLTSLKDFLAAKDSMQMITCGQMVGSALLGFDDTLLVQSSAFHDWHVDEVQLLERMQKLLDMRSPETHSVRQHFIQVQA
jgi:hypothetical protein